MCFRYRQSHHHSRWGNYKNNRFFSPCRHFLKLALQRAYDCRKAYYLYSQQGNECEVNCSDIVLFWRIQQVIKVTANALRQQIINREARRLDKEIKMVLDEFSDDEPRKEQLLTGKRVTLAEELSKYMTSLEINESINTLNHISIN